MTNFAFIDINTQKCFIEHFGRLAIEGAVNIRENLMHLSYLAIEKRIPVISPIFEQDVDCPKDSNDYAKTLDTELPPEHEHFLLSHGDLEKAAAKEVLEKCQKLKVDTVYIYGVPLENSVKAVALQLSKHLKVWIVKDCVKCASSDLPEEDILKDLKQAGIKSISTRILDKFLRDDC